MTAGYGAVTFVTIVVASGMDDARVRSLWPLTFWEAVAEALAVGAILVIVLALNHSHGEAGVITMALLALLTYIFLSILARLQPRQIAMQQYAQATPERRRAIIIGYRTFLTLVKAEVLALFAAMLTLGVTDHRAPMTGPEGAVTIGFVVVLFTTIIVFMQTVLKPRE